MFVVALYRVVFTGIATQQRLGTGTLENILQKETWCHAMSSLAQVDLEEARKERIRRNHLAILAVLYVAHRYVL